MSDEILKATVSQVMQQGGQQVSFGWQGGEPTLMGLDFFRRAVDYQQQYGRPGQVVGNGLQTNGLVIDQEWAKFLADHQFLVGLSLDGPQHIHDKYRHFPSGKGSWEKISRARDILLDAGAQVNALIVVNDYSVQHAQEIYQYHKTAGMNFMQFIPCVETDPHHAGQAAPFSVAGPEYGKFLIDLFDLWIGDFRNGQPTTSIRFFDSVFYSYVGMTPPECTLLQECGIYVVIEHNGDVYSCDFFVEPEWRLGNVEQDKLSDLLNSPKQNEFGRIKAQRPAECETCKWLDKCWGGCPKDRQGDPRDRGSNHFCQAFQMFFEHANSKLESLAKEWRNAQSNQRQQSRMNDDAQIIGRNDPCPCGSGRKFKKCCGRE